jgi:hypothetical protein
MTRKKRFMSTEMQDTIGAFVAGFMGALAVNLVLIFGYGIAAR